MTRRPDLFLIGAPRCGTTSIYEYLRGHPEIHLSSFKEPRYFCPDIDRGMRAGLRYGADEARYLALFDGASTERRVGEGTTRYLYSRQAPALIGEFESRPYLVAALRDPVAMAHSLHWHLHALGIEPIRDFDAALAAEDGRRAGRATAGEPFPELLLYRDWARFGEQLQRWQRQLDAARLHVMVFEDFVASPEQRFGDLLAFLEVDTAYRPATFDALNSSHAARSGVARRATRAPVVRWLRGTGLPRLVGDTRLRRALKPLGGLNRRQEARPPLDGSTRDRLRAELAPDVALAGRLLGRDLERTWWH